MSSTNKTINLELSQFIGSDKPQWLVDYNGDMSKIDTGVATVKAQADATDLTVASHTSSIATLTQASSDQGSAITALRADVDGNTGSINTINSLIGNGEPTTTDKTLIGAINELKADIDEIAPSGGVEADDVAYDNTTSGLTATDVQAAIDEVKAEVDDISTGLNYSSTERVCGSWINGKPLYEKVISSTFPVVTTNGTFETKTVPHGIVNGDLIFAPESFLTAANSPRPLPALTNSNHSAKFAIDATNVQLVSDATAFSEAEVVIVLRYTKTTD